MVNNMYSKVDTVPIGYFSKPAERAMKYKLRQGLLTFIWLLQAITCGSVQGFSSVLFEQLEQTREIVLTTDKVSWIASIPTLTMLPMVLMSGWILGLAGRRLTLNIVFIVTFVAFLMTSCSTTYELLFASRLIGGALLGLAYPAALTYLGEATHPRNRPTCLTSIALGASLGVLLTQLLGTYIHWKTLSFIISVVPVFNMILSRFLAESHVWLLNKNRIQEAKAAFIWFRGHDEVSLLEFTTTLDSKINQTNQKNKNRQEQLRNMLLASVLNFRNCFNCKFIKPFLLTTLVFLTGEFSGDIALIFYTSRILKLMTGDPQAQFITNLALNILRVVATFVAALLMKKFSVRMIFIVTGFMTAFTLANLTLFLFLSDAYPDNAVFPVVCLVAVTMNVAFFALGLGPLPTVICGEMYPAAVRDIGGALSAFVAFLSSFTIVKMIPFFYEMMAPGFIFLFFTCCTFVGVSVVSCTLPNTRNKTLKEIESMYS